MLTQQYLPNYHPCSDFTLWCCYFMCTFNSDKVTIENELLRPISSAAQDHITFRLYYSLNSMKLGLLTCKSSSWQKMLELRSKCSPKLANFLYSQSSRSFLPLPPKIQLVWGKNRNPTQFCAATGRSFIKIQSHTSNLISFRPQHKSESLTMEVRILMAFQVDNIYLVLKTQHLKTFFAPHLAPKH